METLPEKSEKGRYRLKYRGTECLNCGHPLDLSDKFCPNCSQANSTKKISLKDFLDEFFSSLISYDSKLLMTLGSLLWRPGKITREYINGKRISYTNPFRFLLSLAIVYFLLINFSGNFSKWDKQAENRDIEIIQNLGEIPIDLSQHNRNADYAQELDSLQKLIDIDKLKEMDRKKDSLILASPTKYFNSIGNDENESPFSQKHSFFRTLLLKDSIYDFDDAKVKYKVPDTFGNQAAFNVAHGFLNLQTSPGTFVSVLISKLPFAIFFFLPVFSLFIWLAYIRKNYSYTDHLIFSFHNTALLFILLIVSYLISSIFDVSLNWLFLMAFCVYLFIAMRRFYGQGIFKTIVKYLFLNFIFFILGVFTSIVLFTGNIFTF